MLLKLWNQVVKSKYRSNNFKFLKLNYLMFETLCTK